MSFSSRNWLPPKSGSKRATVGVAPLYSGQRCADTAGLCRSCKLPGMGAWSQFVAHGAAACVVHRQGRRRLSRSMIARLAARKMEFKAERRNTTPPHHYWDRNDEPVSSLGPTPLEHFKPTWQQGNAILQG
mmetsp:Transcript_66069/g.127628  ORF Transcript_66069/g.127628 Transcript_66069/m.127628 type:complete len:131 (+) Transcript_66069:1876-2268(+)